MLCLPTSGKRRALAAPIGHDIERRTLRAARFDVLRTDVGRCRCSPYSTTLP